MYLGMHKEVFWEREGMKLSSNGGRVPPPPTPLPTCGSEHII